jgi:hypothetical protein
MAMTSPRCVTGAGKKAHDMRIKSESSYWAWTVTFAGLVTLGFMSLFAYLMYQQGRGSWFLSLFLVPFFLMGFALSWWGLRALVRLACFGHWHIEVPHAGVLGQGMDIFLLPNRDLTPVKEIECHLYCIQNDSINTGKTRSSNIKTLWEKTWTVPSQRIGKDAGLRLQLPFPDASELEAPNPFASKRQWKLTVNVPLRPLSDAPMFEIPASMGSRHGL